ncbi:MAG: sensor histidine kinase [Methanobacteriales archaeon]|nr:sensor histidine kinase [Methanobacteriales archaeon]
MHSIINELFTNAIKHAFPGDRKGTIRVEFKEKGWILFFKFRMME